MIIRVFAILAVLTGVAVRAAGQNSLFQREVLAAQAVPVSTSYGYSAPTISMIATEKPKPLTFAKHDLVTIIVREQASQSTSADLQTSRDSSIDGKIDAWTSIHTSGQVLQPSEFKEGKPALKGELKREFDGSGSSSRTDSLIARIQAEIIEVKPNGNLVIQASKLVKTDEETYTMTLTGVCRTKDITPDNTILSTQIAELEIVKESTGASKDASKRGLVHKFLDWVNIL